MAAWTTPADVIGRWVGTGVPSASSSVLAELIADAEDEILRHYPKIDVRIEAGSLPLRRVQRVVSDVVMRAYKIAGDYRTNYSETTGPFSQSGGYAAETPRVVRLTSEEIEILAPSDDEPIYSLNMLPQRGPGWGYTVIDPMDRWGFL